MIHYVTTLMNKSMRVKINQLDNIFGDKWYQPFKDWFGNNFNLPIKTIE